MIRPTNSMNSTKLVTKSGSGPSKMVIELRLLISIDKSSFGDLDYILSFGRVRPVEQGIAQMSSVQHLHTGWSIEIPRVRDIHIYIYIIYI